MLLVSIMKEQVAGMSQLWFKACSISLGEDLSAVCSPIKQRFSAVGEQNSTDFLLLLLKNACSQWNISVIHMLIAAT